MSKTLIIVESPNKCPKIRQFLGGEYSVQASVGHIREIPPDCPPLSPENGFQPTYKVYRDKGDVVKKLKEEAKRCSSVLIATDPDREGEAIAWHIWDIFDKSTRSKCQRIVFNEITKSAIIRAISKPREIDGDLVSAQKARQVLDRLIGFTVSPVLWQHVASKTSAGRVQSVALKIICERQLEIDAFVPSDYWHVDASLKCKEGQFIARLKTDNPDNRILDSKIVSAIVPKLKSSTYSIKDVKGGMKEIRPNPPFDTSSLQTACSSIFGWNLSKTMQLAQKLYESAKISYIRTDSYSISDEAMEAVRKFISAEHGKEYLPASAEVYHKKSGAAAQEAHECIRPTHIDDEGEDLGDDALKLYNLIRARFISCQMAPAKVRTVDYLVEASCGEELFAQGKCVEFKGWLLEWEKYGKTKEVTLPPTKVGEELKLLELKSDKKSTKPPERWNDGSLVKKLESEGVGRPSTHAGILKNLVDRLYVARDGKALVPTELGMNIYKFLNSKYGDFFMDIKYTSKVEDALDAIASGKLQFLQLVQKVYDKLQVVQERIVANSNLPVCTKCRKGNIVEKDGKWGKWWTCNRFPQCKTTFFKLSDGSYREKAPKAE